MKYLPFEEAREFVHGLRLKNRSDWKIYSKSGNKPEEIPSSPVRPYRKEWKGWGDWLGTGAIATFNRKYLDFETARAHVRALKLSGKDQWGKYSKSGNKPLGIPFHPERTYKKQWKGFGDWLGTGAIATFNRKYLDFEAARAQVQALKLKGSDEWRRYLKSGRKSPEIPNRPDKVYKQQWNGLGDWLGTGAIATFNRKYLDFEAARAQVQALTLNNKEQWAKYCKSGRKPPEIPNRPDKVYKKEWKDWADWLGYDDPTWSLRKVKELLTDLIRSRVIYEWHEAVLYSLLLRKGLLNLHENNRHRQFFKNLLGAVRTDEGRQLVENYVKSDSDIPPNLAISQSNQFENLEEIQPASPEELSQIVENVDPLEYGRFKNVEHILKQTDVLESINVDEEAIQFYLNYSIVELWKLAFENRMAEDETVKKLRLAGKNENLYHDRVVEGFLADYNGTRTIRLPEDYSFPMEPTLMQLFVTYKVKNLPYFGNFSATGAGKTLSAILASRVIDSKMTVIVCPNDVVNQWSRSILEVFPKSKVVTGKKSFSSTNSANEHQYLVLNYDKFSQPESPNLILTLAKQKVDFVIMDEIHFTKIRDEEEVSKRRRNLDGLMTLLRKGNPLIKVLGLSATPVVNNLREGKSLVELITGKIYDDISTKPTIPNAVTLYEKLSTISIRELPKYYVDIDRKFVDVEAQKPSQITLKHLKSNPLAIEKFLTDARIPEIIRLIDGQTIIYTEYIEDIVKKISQAIEQAGYSYAFYIGTDRSGLSRFLKKEIQVLIASRPISVGVDGLQFICNRLIINTLPWTNAQYQQLLGRLVRRGQIRDVVHLYIIRASIDGYPYDDLKWKRIQFKRTLADCAVDGTLPEKNLVTPQQAAMEAVRWLERLERGEISTVVRRDLNVVLAPIEIRKRIAKFGDFSKLNNRINNENSETTHHRMTNNPIEWEEYHRQYREARKTWNVIPYDEIVRRIKELSPRLMIGDFGCGEAKILEEFGDKRVYSFDHVTITDKVTACDMKTVPLPDEAIDIAVFSLSLMGRNWSDYIVEAKRCLATNGYLLIAETTKSVKGRMSTIRDVIKKQGFDIYSDEEKGDFTFIEAREL